MRVPVIFGLVAALAFLTACGGYSQTVRVVDGKKVAGRAIPSAAYAAALRAAYLEAHGQYAAAIVAYRQALRYDDESVELQTRVARLTCLMGSASANEEFATAVSLGADYAPAWQEWARCALDHGHVGQALRFATRAQAVAPLEFSSTELLVDALSANDQPELARRQLVAHLSAFSENLRGWQKLLDFAEQNALPQWVRAATANIDRLAPKTRVPLSGKPLDTEAEGSAEAVRAIGGALNNGDLPRARELATDFRLAPTQLALLAAERGYFAEALAQALLVVNASPSNTDARIVGLVCAHRLARDDQFRALLRIGGHSPVAPSPRASRLFESLLADEAGPAAAIAWKTRTELKGEF